MAKYMILFLIWCGIVGIVTYSICELMGNRCPVYVDE